MNRTRKTRKRTSSSSGRAKTGDKVVKLKAKKSIPSFSVTYKDADNSVKTAVVEMDDYQSSLSYKENFEDQVASVLADGGVWIQDKYVIPTHRILRFKINKYEEPKDIKKTTAKKASPQTKKATAKVKGVKGVKGVKKEIKEGKVCKGGVNARPTTPPPPPPIGQGGSSEGKPDTSVSLLNPQYLTEGYDPKIASTN